MFFLRQTISFLIIIVLSSNSYSTQRKSENISLTISGGISLGIYEAGLNYILLESSNKPDKSPNITTFTGASAGAINALTSALHTCTDPNKYKYSATNNLFRDIWINVDIKDLIPKDQSKYNTLLIGGKDETGSLTEINDSLLSRGVFLEPIEKLRSIYDSNAFKKDCTALVGIIVTLTQPNILKVAVNIDNPEVIELPVQSYAIALRLETTPSKGGYKPQFKNIDIKEIDSQLLNKSKRQYIRLVENQDQVVSFESVLRASLASSAFPLAFGSIKFPYCIESENPGNKNYGCQDKYEKKWGTFIDGGVFDNIPLGLAVELNSSSKQKIDEDTYIYLDPDNLRINKEATEIKQTNFSISSQVSSILPSVTTSRKQVLRKDIENLFDSRNKDNKKRTYSPTKRIPDLTGSFLGAFGAFFDRSFRDYDYIAGIYDGLRYSSIKSCELNDNKPRCEASEFRRLINKHINEKSKNNEPIRHQLGLFLCYEFGRVNFNTTNTCSFLNDEYGEVISKLVSHQQDPLVTLIYQSIPNSETFQLFLQKLRANLDKYNNKNGNVYVHYSHQLNYMMRQPGFWMNLFSQNILERLIIKEKETEGNAGQLLMPAYIMTAPEILSQKYDISPSEKHNAWYIPDRIGLDAAQTGLVINYSDEFTPDIIGNNYIQLGFTGNPHWKDNGRSNVAFLNLGLRRPRPSIFLSSIGFDVTANRNILSNDNYSLGLEFNFGTLSENIRLSAGTRDVLHNREDEDYILRLSISNIDRMIWAN